MLMLRAFSDDCIIASPFLPRLYVLEFNIACVHWVFLDETFLKMTEMIFGKQNGVLTFSDEAPDK